MSIVIGLILLGVALSCGVGFGLAALFFKDGSGRMAGGIVISVICMVVIGVIAAAGCGSLLNMH